MATQPQIFTFPLKGVSRVGARSAQPPGTAWDMLNVLPMDANLRLRGGKRPGDAKLWSQALGESSDDAILLLQQVTLITAAPPGMTTIFEDDFTYANGELDSVSSSIWSVENMAMGGTSTDAIVATNVVTLGNVPDGVWLYPTAPPTMDFTAGYSVEATVSLNLTPAGNAVAFYLETDLTDLFITGGRFRATVSTDGADFSLEFFAAGTTNTPGVDYFLGTATGVVTNTPFLLRVDVTAGTGSSRVARVYINDVQIGGFDCPLPVSVAGADNFLFGLSNTHATLKTTFDTVSITSGTDTSPTAVPVRTTKIIAIANRDVYVGDIDTQGTLATGGENVTAQHVLPEAAFSAGKLYIVDGDGDPVQLDVATATMEAYTESAGTVPEDCTLACIWRDRLVLAAPTGSEQLFFMSRVGDQHDWDYDPADPEDPARAFEGQGSTAGHIGEPLVALMPMSDDLLTLGGDHNLWVIRGDPADNGSIDLVSNTIGVLGPRAWCQDPNGAIYFLGTFGLYRFTGTGAPECVSDENFPQFFSNIDRSRFYIEMAWDRDLRGIYIFLLEANTDEPPTSLFWSDQTKGFFPLQFPNDHGPTSILVYDGDDPDDRKLLLGGKDGFLRTLQPDALDDDGEEITSYVEFAPIILGDQSNDGILSNVNITLGEPTGGFTADDFGVDVTVRAGLTAYDVTEGVATAKLHTFGRRYDGQTGRLNSLRQKVRGVFGAIRLSDTSDDKTWNFETVSLDIEPAGRTRR